MVNIVLKTISVLGLSFLTVVLFLMGQFPLIEGIYLLDKYNDTRFAKDYSPEKFEQVKVGMEFSEVINIIGQPLYTHKGTTKTSYTTYNYTGDGKFWSESAYDPVFPYGDFAWYQSKLLVNSENIVVRIEKGWLHN